MGGLIVDTSVFVQIERRGGAVDFTPFAQYSPFAISAITVSELLIGVHRADTEQRRERRHQFVQAVLANVNIVSFDRNVAATHALIAAEMAKHGTLIGAHDLQIAATALHYGSAILTANPREFQRVPRLQVLVFV